MRFSFTATAIFALVAATPSAATQWTDQLTEDIHNLAVATRAIWPSAGAITRVDGPLFADNLGQFPKIVSALKDIVTKTNAATASIPKDLPNIELKDMYPIDWAYYDFLTDQQILLNVLNLKAHKFTDSIPIASGPLIDVLKELGPAIDCFAEAATLLVLPEPHLLENKRETLDKTITAAISNYSPKTARVKRTFTA